MLYTFIQYGLVVAIIAANLFLLWIYTSEKKQKTIMSDADAETFLMEQLGCTRWKARLIIMEEKDKAMKEVTDKLQEAGLLEPHPTEVDKYGEPVFKLTELGESMYSQMEKHSETNQNPLKINLDHLISKQTKSQDSNDSVGV